MQRLSPSGGCGGPWRSGATEARRRARRRQDGGRDGGRDEGRDVRANEGATIGNMTVARRRPQRRSTVARWRPQRGLDGGTTVAASFSTVARRWLPPFHLLFGGGARPTTLTSWTEAQSAMERANPDGGHGGGELREREDDEQ